MHVQSNLKGVIMDIRQKGQIGHLTDSSQFQNMSYQT